MSTSHPTESGALHPDVNERLSQVVQRWMTPEQREDAVLAVLDLSPDQPVEEITQKIAAFGFDLVTVEAWGGKHRATVIDRRLGAPDEPVIGEGRTAAEAICRATARAVLRATAGAGPEA
ncbi:MAG: hypothetical protein C4346_15840 [Chloroflexota bacterium]